MAKDKERTLNPAQAQRKLEKAKALKKSKAELQTRRNEKLARRNPDRIQRQIDDLKALEASGDIKAREKAILADLERDLKAVHKAREVLGVKEAPQHGGNKQPPRRDGNDTVLGKRQHNGQPKPKPSYNPRCDSSASDTDISVRRIPMPEDTPPPIPREHRRYFNKDNQVQQAPPVIQPSKTTYSAAPQVRDLKKEAISKFVPSIVRQKQAAARGTGGLVEPEEMDRLEAEGYLRTNHERDNGNEVLPEGGDRDRAEGDVDTNMNMSISNDVEARKLEEEELRFQREIAMQDAEPDLDPEQEEETCQGNQQHKVSRPRNVEIEEVEDEDA